MSNENLDDRWLWFIDDGPLQALLKAESAMPSMKMRAASSPALVRAVSLHMEGRTAQAITELTAAIDGGDRHPDVYLMLGQFQAEAQQWEAAADVYRRLAEVDPKHPLGAFNLGVCQLRQGDWSACEASFRQATSLQPSRTEAHLGLAIASLQLQKGIPALEGFDRVLAKEPKSEPARFGRAAALQLLKRYPEALAEYEKLPAEPARQVAVLTNQVAAAAATRDTAALQRYASQLLSCDPKSAVAAEALGAAALLNGDYRAATRHLEAAAGAGAESIELWTNLAMAAARSGDDAQTEAALLRALELQPNHSVALLERAALEDRRGTAADARREWEKAAAGTRSEIAYWNLALAAQRQGDAKAAVEALQRLVGVNRQRHDAWYLLGELLAADSRPAEAAKAFAEALRIKPDWLDAQFNFGLLAWRAGHLDRAWQAFESAVARQSDRAELHEAMTQLAIERGDATRAADALRRLERRGGAGEALTFNVALTLQRTGRAKEAEALYRRTLTANPAFIESLINLGHALEAQGDRDGAAECWQRAVQLRPELAG